ncbi:MAG: methyltransferase domain-containing protein [Pseudomonadota bacterium]|jgi:SAM-dependent methyltransferase
MKLGNFRYYRCPSCRSDQLLLEIGRQKEEGSIEEGEIECGKCSAKYRIARGLPRFVSEVNYADSFGFQWNIHAKTQLDSYSGLPVSRNRVFGVTRWDVNLPGERILEAGSGAGRFTEVLLSTGAEVVSFDYSTAVDANCNNNGRNENLILFQGDIFNIPLELASFDKVFCLGVLQHTPDPAAAFASLARYVRPGGVLAVDAYTRNVAAWLQWKYLLRPITKHMKKQKLYRLIEYLTPMLIPVAKVLRRIAGRAGARLVPIVEYNHLGLSPELNRQWAILDTFDMYSPAHDHPQSLADVRRWFESAGFVEIDVRYGPNGVVGTGRKPG